MTTQKILKRHIGHAIDFQSSQKDEQPINGKIERVKNGIATIRFHVVRAKDDSLRTFDEEGFTAYLPVTDPRIIEIY